MRLIDADKLKKVIHCAYSDDLEILEKIDLQPTAYDIDKVVEELELHSFEFGTDILPAHYVRLYEAIKIVKAGAKND